MYLYRYKLFFVKCINKKRSSCNLLYYKAFLFSYSNVCDVNFMLRASVVLLAVEIVECQTECRVLRLTIARIPSDVLRRVLTRQEKPTTDELLEWERGERRLDVLRWFRLRNLRAIRARARLEKVFRVVFRDRRRSLISNCMVIFFSARRTTRWPRRTSRSRSSPDPFRTWRTRRGPTGSSSWWSWSITKT